MLRRIARLVVSVAVLGACDGDDASGAPDLGPPELDLGDPGQIDSALADLGAPADGGGAPPGPEKTIDPSRYDCRGQRLPEPPMRPAAPGCHLTLSCSSTLVVTNRGGTRFAPENTLAAIRASISFGVDIVEVDVRRTSDGTLVLLHDPELDRTTDGSGNVVDSTLEDIQALSIVPEAEDPPGDWSCERVPTLDEVFELARGRIVVGLHARSDTFPDLDVAIADYIVANDLTEDSFLYCYDPGRCAAARMAQPFVPVVARAFFGEALADGRLTLVPAPLAVEIDAREEDYRLIPRIRAFGAKVFVLAYFAADPQAALVGDLDAYDVLLADGVDALITRQPHLLLRALDRLDD